MRTSSTATCWCHWGLMVDYGDAKLLSWTNEPMVVQWDRALAYQTESPRFGSRLGCSSIQVRSWNLTGWYSSPSLGLYPQHHSSSLATHGWRNLIFSSPHIGERDTNGIFEVNCPSTTHSQGRKSLTTHKGLSRFNKHISLEGLRDLPITISDNVFLLIHGV